MKNYLNTQEQIQHLVLMLAMTIADELKDGSGITTEEREMLIGIVAKIKEFNDSVFDRMGNSYARSISNKARDNTLTLRSRPIGKTTTPEISDVLDNDILQAIIDTSADMECENCKRTDCKNCTIYKIKTYLRYEGKSEDNDFCPFRKEEKEYDFDYLDL